jgi:hypothetical protein
MNIKSPHLPSLFMALGCLLSGNQAMAWGQNGHRVTGAIAEQYLSPEAKAVLAQLLPNEDLAEASTYADEMRADPDVFWQKTSYPWHFVTVPDGKTYTEVGAPEVGDAYTALQRFSGVLKDPASSVADKQLALRFIVHIIGDLHQPLHVGNGTDKGGNDVKLKFFWNDSNLHSVWDTGLIEQRDLSYTEWTDFLGKKISSEQASKWMESDPLVWIAESAEIRQNIYPDSDNLSWSYLYEQTPTIKMRLQMAGLRIAAYLNALFKK